jgi:hypothetical protein
MLRLLLPLFLCGVLLAEVRMSVAQLRSFLSSSSQLGHSDKQVADFLKNIKLTEKLDASTIEDLQAGARTTQVLKQLAESSKALPVAAPPPVRVAAPTIPPPDSIEQKRILAAMTEYAQEYGRRLPNFICTQVTRRYIDPSGMEFWQRADVVTAKLSYFEQKEDYKIVLVNDQMVNTTQDRIGGATSTGEFGSMLKEIFEPGTEASFEWERWATLRGRRMHVFHYFVTQPKSKWSIMFEKSQAIRPAYSGLIYVDRDTLSIMRLTLQAEEIPPSFPVQEAKTVLDYDNISISGVSYVLPLKAVVRMRSEKVLIKNEAEFRMYNRFGAESSITYTPDPLSDDQIMEAPLPQQPSQPGEQPSQK